MIHWAGAAGTVLAVPLFSRLAISAWAAQSGEVAPTWWRSIDECIICMQYEMAMVAHVSLSGTSSPVVCRIHRALAITSRV